MFFPIEFTLLDFYRIISYGIWSYKSNECVGNFPVESKSYTIPMQILWIKIGRKMWVGDVASGVSFANLEKQS
jgi:hypothetical protein